MSTGLDAELVVKRGGLQLDLSLAIAPETTVALLGPNGAGKTTGVEALAGLVALDDGHITLAGRDLDRPSTGVFVPAEDRLVGVVFQQHLLFDHLTVVDNIAFGLVSRGRPRREARRLAGEWIDRFDLASLASRRPPELSGGQSQRVALARALAPEPELLLLDEPLAAVDVGTRAALRRTLVSHLGGFTGPTLLITHDPVDALLLAEQVVVIEDGTVTQTGTPDEIRQRPATGYVAALAGTNLLTGTNLGGTLTLDDHAHRLQAADTRTAGPVLITIAPAAVALHPEEPHGSPRNTWLTTVTAVEPLGDTTRIVLAEPLPLLADITPAATDALALAPGSPIWATVKATEIVLRVA